MFLFLDLSFSSRFPDGRQNFALSVEFLLLMSFRKDLFVQLFLQVHGRLVIKRMRATFELHLKGNMQHVVRKTQTRDSSGEPHA